MAFVRHPKKGPRSEGAPEDNHRGAGRSVLSPRFAEETFPWVQVGGYAGSLALTAASLVLVAHDLMPAAALLAVILVLAGGQAALQLGVFMHLRESWGPSWQLLPLSIALFTALAMVGMSLWIMTFKWGVS